jgi:putative Mg2+ transporter-C (MgtC) family protein
MSEVAQMFAEALAWIHTDHAGRIVLSVVLGGLIGLERELGDKPAGFRTIILICVGACVFTIVSQLIGGPDWDNTRIAAQIVSGIGFLGAGAILRDRQSVYGLTSAATIWAVAAIGMACGFGLWELAVEGSIFILVALLVFEGIEKWIGARRDIQDYDVATRNGDDALRRLDALFKHASLRVRKRFYYEEGDQIVVHLVVMGAKADHDRVRWELVRSDDYTLRAP